MSAMARNPNQAGRIRIRMKESGGTAPSRLWSVPDLAFLFPIAVLLAFSIGAGVYQTIHRTTVETGRDKAYQAYCAEHNFEYVAKRPGGQKAYEASVPLFRYGWKRTWRHEISGAIERRHFAAFEYSYSVGRSSTVSFGSSAGGYRAAAVMRWDLPGANLPAFTVAPASFLDRVREDVLESDDVLSLGDPDLPNPLTVKGDPNKVSALLTDSVREVLQAWPNQHLAGSGDLLFWWCDGWLPPAAGMDGFLSFGDRVRAQVEAVFKPV